MSKKIVGVIRLSRADDDSTSIARQKERIEAWVKFKGWVIVGWAIDDGVSAIKLSPWDRPKLGPWLTRHEEYDVLVCWKLDRLARNTADFVDLLRWADEHTVSIVATDDAIDLSSTTGRMVAQILAVFAEFEGKTIKLRAKQSRDGLVKLGRWYGGTAPYGYKAVKDPTGGHRLQVDTEEKAVVLEAVERAIKGESIRSISLDFTKRGVPRPHAPRKNTTNPEEWTNSSLIGVLRSPALLGQRLHNGEIVRDPDTGLPGQYAEPLITRSEFGRLQVAMDVRSSPHALRHGKVALLRVVYCGECQCIVYRYHSGKKMNYRCRAARTKSNDCSQLSFPLDEVESLVFDEFLAKVGHLEVQHKVYVPASDEQDALETAQSAYKDALEQLSTTKSSSGRKELRETLSVLDGRIEALENQETVEAHYEYEGIGQSYREYFDSLDPEAKGDELRSAGVKAFILRINEQKAIGMVLPKDIEERVKAVSPSVPFPPVVTDWKEVEKITEQAIGILPEDNIGVSNKPLI